MELGLSSNMQIRFLIFFNGSMPGTSTQVQELDWRFARKLCPITMDILRLKVSLATVRVFIFTSPFEVAAAFYKDIKCSTFHCSKKRDHCSRNSNPFPYRLSVLWSVQEMQFPENLFSLFTYVLFFTHRCITILIHGIAPWLHLPAMGVYCFRHSHKHIVCHAPQGIIF